PARDDDHLAALLDVQKAQSGVRALLQSLHGAPPDGRRAGHDHGAPSFGKQTRPAPQATPPAAVQPDARIIEPPKGALAKRSDGEIVPDPTAPSVNQPLC